MGIETALLIAGTAAAMSSAGAGIAGAASGGGGGGLTTTKIRLTPKTRAAQSLAARQLAAASTYKPPSLLEYAESGGTVEDLLIPGPTPLEAMRLGLVDPYGKAIDYYTGGDLTKEQLLAAGRERRREKKGRKTLPVERLERMTRRRQRARVAEDWDKFERIGVKRRRLRKKLGLTGGSNA